MDIDTSTHGYVDTERLVVAADRESANVGPDSTCYPLSSFKFSIRDADREVFEGLKNDIDNIDVYGTEVIAPFCSGILYCPRNLAVVFGNFPHALWRPAKRHFVFSYS